MVSIHDLPTKRIERAISAAIDSAKTSQAKSRIEQIQLFYKYSEPGYDIPRSGVIAAGNWNDITEFDEQTRQSITIDNTVGRLGNVLEKLSVELEWSDEWTTCDDCLGLVRIHPDCWEWTPNFVTNEDCTLCLECLDKEEYLSSIEGYPEQINSIFYPEEYGYILIQDDFQRGLHYGQNADPRLVADILEKAGFERFLFYLDSKRQFDCSFSVWLHKEEAEADDGEGIILAKQALEREKTDGPSIAAAMKAGFEQASKQADAIQSAGNPGVIVSKVSMNNCETKVVSMKDFVDGKALD